jgi:AcrR family transcriptional regulator
MARDTGHVSRGSTVDRLIEVAERLFAEDGLDGVSLRQIAAEAGSANNSAVRYHFGSKDALVTAIIEYRLPHLIQRRELLSARSDPDDLRSVLEAHLLPVVDMAESTDNHYLIFIEQLQRYGRGEDHPFLHVSPPLRDSHRTFIRTAGALLGHLPEELRTERIGAVSAVCLHASADRQRALRFGAPQRSYALHVNDLFDGLVGYLNAAASSATLRALNEARPLRRSKKRT